MEDLAELRGESDKIKPKRATKRQVTRIENDKKDREALKNQLDMCIHPMKPEDHPENLMNISNGTIAVPQVNVVIRLFTLVKPTSRI